MIFTVALLLWLVNATLRSQGFDTDNIVSMLFAYYLGVILGKIDAGTACDREIS